MKDFRSGNRIDTSVKVLRTHLASDRGGSLQIDELLHLVERLTASRDVRKMYIKPDILAEPGWDMLVHLYHADLTGYRSTISNLARASGVPTTTALRWISVLVENGLAERNENRFDKRSIFIEITEEARAKMYDYLCHVWAIYYG
jgi:DNA-binding MarR family transcriptional regulator